MKAWVKKSLCALAATCAGIGIICLPFLIFLKPANDFVFGNFHSYISSDVQDTLTEQYNIKWQYYSTNSEIPTYIQNKTLDIAIATNNAIGELAKDGKLREIPWADFQLTYKDNSNTTQTVKTYEDMKNVVTDSAWQICEIIGKELKIDNLLKYTVPYFLQNFVFVYRGQKMDSLSETASFKDIFSFISKEPRFTKKYSSVMVVDDSRTMYDVAKLVENTNNDINPSSPNDEVTIHDIDKTFDNVAQYYQSPHLKDVITFNGDSSIVLNKVALNQSAGGFMYNGDAIYAAIGGDNADTTPGLPTFENNNSDYHVVIPTNNMYAFDGIVINKDINENKLPKAIDIIKELCLSGLYEGEDISEYDNSIDDYKYMSVQNFAFVNYTPVYKKLYDFTTNISNTNNQQNYWVKEIGDYNQNKAQIDLLIKLTKIESSNITKNNIEMPTSDLFTSNLNIAYLTFKNKM